jgi:hypothetical protein
MDQTNLTEEEENALGDYKSGNADIREFLIKSMKASDNKEVYEKIMLLDSAIAKNKLKNKTLLYRGTFMSEIENNRINCIFSPPLHFISTSTDRKAAVYFAARAKPNSAILKIKAPKGIPGVFLKGKAPWAKAEKELLLERNPIFIILCKRTITSEKYCKSLFGENTDIKIIRLYTLKIIKSRFLRKILLRYIKRKTNPPL